MKSTGYDSRPSAGRTTFTAAFTAAAPGPVLTADGSAPSGARPGASTA